MNLFGAASYKNPLDLLCLYPSAPKIHDAQNSIITHIHNTQRNSLTSRLASRSG